MLAGYSSFFLSTYFPLGMPFEREREEVGHVRATLLPLVLLGSTPSLALFVLQDPKWAQWHAQNEMEQALLSCHEACNESGGFIGSEGTHLKRAASADSFIG